MRFRLGFLSLLAAAFSGLNFPASAQADFVLETEEIAGSTFPVSYHLVETDDGLYTPIALRKPSGDGPFPIVVFTSGNGGLSLEYLKDRSHNRSWMQEQLLDAGYAVAWLRYRAEVLEPVYDASVLENRARSSRAVFNRTPYEYEDVIRIIEYVGSLPYIDGARVGYFGSSHGGEMLMKITRVYDGIAAGVAAEPASAAFLGRTGPGPSDPETVSVFDEQKLAAAIEDSYARIDRKVALERLSGIDTPILVFGRDRDHNQDIFRINYELLSEAGKDVAWKSYDHELHGFAYVWRSPNGKYEPDAVQREAVADAVAFFDSHLK